MAIGRGIFFLFSVIALPSFVEVTPDVLTGESTQQGEGDEPPAVPHFYPQIDDDRNGDVDVEIPRYGEFLEILPQVAERYVNGNGQKDDSYDRQDVASSFHFRIVGSYGIFVNALVA